MKIKKLTKLGAILLILFMCIYACSNKHTSIPNALQDTESAFNYLKGLEGKWIVQGGKEGIFGWEFELTSKEGVLIERLKVGTQTEMLTVYNLEDEYLLANHFCQLQNQPNLIAVTSEIEGDLHFQCNGNVGNTKSHDELHMHGVHFQKKDSKLIIWMDMFENGEIAFETRYKLTPVDSQ
ncbi:MAG: hypothetical protein HN729_12255 [Candidatus Marinimicrobia bacterium]|nr:hypothetical protein [Candidatus Neomarinimicrobiota bacterium]MBT3634253.1 hypothetical protein [Candidatus Neomarinimicrobiota bacterium]MBT3682948.1 hypothetical protein [Candidatus Neomarinimicrobiota bacterium]MBT3760062.1 hypothetical protein [Candidatus Neomarinimicrobiota bacterium]MBT3896171.1 hypothetical protein [Candidatus Neomarinimicrobiota bacterium]